MSPQTRHTVLIASIVSLGGFVFGFDASVISGVVGYVRQEFGLNDWQTGFVVSAPTLGAVISALCAGPLSDKIGRKRTLVIIAFLYTLSAIASALAVSFTTLSAARFIGGLAFGSLMIAPIYIAEVSPAKLRGRLVSINQLNIVVGLSAAYFVNSLIQNLSQQDLQWVTQLGLSDNPWRWMLGFETLPALAWFLLLLALPETPRWLLLKGREEEARKVLTRLHESDTVDAEVTEIRDTLPQTEEPLLKRVIELFSPKVRFAILLGVIVGIAQQITGVNAIYFYAPTIFEQSGVGTNAAFTQAIWVGIINVIFTLVSMACIDRFGRRPLLLGGLAGVFISMLLTSWGFSEATYQLTEEDATALSESIPPHALSPLIGQTFDSDLSFKEAISNAIGPEQLTQNESALIQAAIEINATLVLVGILGFVASFAISLGPVMWVLFSEMFPNRIRGIAISFVGLVNSAVSYVVQLVFPWELNTLGTATTFLIYGSFALFFLFLVAALLPETKGKSLESLEHDLARP
ncbi:sugar porter family MFS transporter [Pelagicoccus mobilis]|uniref:Sugar porter family MFS transporter n=1 Tax=Pelagicoccus mobilis TaxID=415221 RepID=A0A934RUC8_9BACT|nr:sugar porter family MFS transporter [Pelagicoccus mobilis]MBK1875580.1 sugar porter family MFS transporter [Pelagicoccus mobilis]